MDIFMLVDDVNSEFIAVGFAKDDMREVLTHLSKNFADANQLLIIHVQYHHGEYGEFIIMIATNKINVDLSDVDGWDTVLMDYIRGLSPNDVESFKIGRFLNLN